MCATEKTKKVPKSSVDWLDAARRFPLRNFHDAMDSFVSFLESSSVDANTLEFLTVTGEDEGPLITFDRFRLHQAAAIGAILRHQGLSIFSGSFGGASWYHLAVRNDAVESLLLVLRNMDEEQRVRVLNIVDGRGRRIHSWIAHYGRSELIGVPELGSIAQFYPTSGDENPAKRALTNNQGRFLLALFHGSHGHDREKMIELANQSQGSLTEADEMDRLAWERVGELARRGRRGYRIRFEDWVPTIMVIAAVLTVCASSRLHGMQQIYSQKLFWEWFAGMEFSFPFSLFHITFVFVSVSLILWPKAQKPRGYENGGASVSEIITLAAKDARDQGIDVGTEEGLSVLQRPTWDKTDLDILRRTSTQYFCNRCGVVKHIGTRHCGECGLCIAGHDHHCWFIGRCVGDQNLGRFRLWCVLLILEGSMAVVNLGKVMWFLSQIRWSGREYVNFCFTGVMLAVFLYSLGNVFVQFSSIMQPLSTSMRDNLWREDWSRVHEIRVDSDGEQKSERLRPSS